MLLYRLRYPFTRIEIREIGVRFADISIYIHDQFVGTLRFRQPIGELLLEIFANPSVPVGTLFSPTEVSWTINPTIFATDQVLDQEGNVHNVSSLGVI